MLAQVFRLLRCSFVVSLLVLSIFISGCAGSQEKGAGAVAGSFVGKADPGEHTLVALVASIPDEGKDERDVKAYLCDGQKIWEWFKGSVAGNDIELTSDGGAELRGSLAPDAATGTITLTDGTSFTFAANLAAGVSGLYNVRISDDGSFSGTSEAGGEVEGQVDQEANSEGVHAISGTVTPRDGQRPLSFEEVGVKHFSPPDDARWIVSNTEIVGAGTKGKNIIAILIG